MRIGARRQIPSGGGLAGDGQCVWELPEKAKMPSNVYDAPYSSQDILEN